MTSGRLRLADLTPDRIRQQPAWKIVGDDEDDTTYVAPLSLPRGKEDRYFVAGTATLPDSSTCPALVLVAHYDKAVQCGPVYLLRGSTPQYVRASDPAFRYTPEPEDRAVLPFKWVLAVALENEAKPRGGSTTASPFARFFKRLAAESLLESYARKRRGSD